MSASVLQFLKEAGFRERITAFRDRRATKYPPIVADPSQAAAAKVRLPSGAARGVKAAPRAKGPQNTRTGGSLLSTGAGKAGLAVGAIGAGMGAKALVDSIRRRRQQVQQQQQQGNKQLATA